MVIKSAIIKDIRKAIGIFFAIFLVYFSSITVGQETVKVADKISFEGEKVSITYTRNRKIDKAPFTIKNNSKETITVKFQAAFLVRGRHHDPLERAAFRIYTQGKWRVVDEVQLRQGQKISLNVTFKPFTVYTGSKYTVMAVVVAEGEKYTATTEFEINKLPPDDKNKYKQGMRR